MNISVGVSVYPNTEEEAAKAVEILSRAAVGLALEGLDVAVHVTHLEDDENERPDHIRLS